MVTLSDLKTSGGLRTEAIWHEALTRVSVEERTYIIAVLKGGQKLTERPKIKISTIHGAKGGQADHVILLTDMVRHDVKAASHGPLHDDEARVWYVATTRAKQKLTIVEPQNSFRAYQLK
jgi:superfamily I DNA/RNA helicase